MNTAPTGSDHPTSSNTGRGRFTVRRTRIGGWWIALITAALVLLFLMIFVLQNGQDISVSFLGAQATLPLGVALLLAAISGVLIVAIPGSGRIIQLRRVARRQATLGLSGPSAPPADPRKADTRAGEPGGSDDPENARSHLRAPIAPDTPTSSEHR